MKGSIIRSALGSGVGKRILALFLIAAVVPMVFTVGLVWNEFNQGLEQETARRLKDGAK